MSNAVNLQIGGYSFACYPLAQATFVNVAAVYVVIGVDAKGGWKVLDVGLSGKLGQRVDDHPRRTCWAEHFSGGSIWVCVYPTPSAQFTDARRLEIERSLRQQYSPPCGQR